MTAITTEFGYQSVRILTNNCRNFIAIYLPVEIKETIAPYIQSLKQLVSSPVKLARPMAAHLTLSFLGNIPRSECPLIAELIDVVPVVPSQLFANWYSWSIPKLQEASGIADPVERIC